MTAHSANLQTVYPRVCGGTSSIRRLILRYMGLSPRVRGNRPRSSQLAWASRSIPACAGEPAEKKVDCMVREVYPRVCGGTCFSTLIDVPS